MKHHKTLPSRAFETGSGNPATASPEPAAVRMACTVRPGHEAEVEAAIVRLVEVCEAMPDYLGATLRRPLPGAGDRHYAAIFRFASSAGLRRFEASPGHAAFVADVDAHVVGRLDRCEITGLEFWFQPAPAPAPAASRVEWRMTLLTVVVVYVLVLLLGRAAELLLPDEPLWVRLLAAVVVQTLLMSYWLMPWATQWLAGWLRPRRRA